MGARFEFIDRQIDGRSGIGSGREGEKRGGGRYWMCVRDDL